MQWVILTHKIKGVGLDAISDGLLGLKFLSGNKGIMINIGDTYDLFLRFLESNLRISCLLELPTR